MRRALISLAFFFATELFGAPRPSDWTQPPTVVVASEVNLSVGEKMALVSGRYWYQYVPKFDPDHTKQISIYYTAIVSSDLTERIDLLDATQVKLMLNDREYRPVAARLLTDEETGPVPTLPHGYSIAWFMFQIPRDRAELRFPVLITHFQPTYSYEGKTVAACWPWMPNLEELRQPLELLDKNFVITIDALPGVELKPVSAITHVTKQTPRQIVVNPLHAETIAVEVEKK